MTRIKKTCSECGGRYNTMYGMQKNLCYKCKVKAARHIIQCGETGRKKLFDERLSKKIIAFPPINLTEKDGIRFKKRIDELYGGSGLTESRKRLNYIRDLIVCDLDYKDKEVKEWT